MGPKSAMRVVMTLLRWPEEQTRRLGASISSLRDQLHICRRCGGLSTTDVCPICQDATRSQDILCLVTDWDSMMTMDRGGFYRGSTSSLAVCSARWTTGIPTGWISTGSRNGSRKDRSRNWCWPSAPHSKPTTRPSSSASSSENAFRPSESAASRRAFPWAAKSDIWTQRRSDSRLSTGRSSKADLPWTDSKKAESSRIPPFLFVRKRSRSGSRERQHYATQELSARPEPG